MSTKGDIVNSAYEELRISGLTSLAGASELKKGLSRLESFMAYLQGKNVFLNYNFEEIPDLNTNTGVHTKHRMMMDFNLAVLLIPSFNKSVPPELKQQANSFLSSSITLAAAENMREVPYPDRQSLGAANALRYYSFQKFYPNIDAKPVGDNIIYMHLTEVNDYFQSFTGELRNSEIISTFTIETQVNVTSSSNTDNRVLFTINAGTSVDDFAFDITITTSDSRILTRRLIIDIRE